MTRAEIRAHPIAGAYVESMYRLDSLNEPARFVFYMAMWGIGVLCFVTARMSAWHR